MEFIAPAKSLRDRLPNTIATTTCFILVLSTWQKSRLATYRSLEKSRTRQKHVGAGWRCRWTRNRKYREGIALPCFSLSLSLRTHSMARDDPRSPKLEKRRARIAKMDSRWIGPEIHGTDDDDDEVARARPRHAIDNSRIFPALNRCHPIRGTRGGSLPLR